jgi:hypothetical protein
VWIIEGHPEFGYNNRSQHYREKEHNAKNSPSFDLIVQEQRKKESDQYRSGGYQNSVSQTVPYHFPRPFVVDQEPFEIPEPYEINSLLAHYPKVEHAEIECMEYWVDYEHANKKQCRQQE